MQNDLTDGTAKVLRDAADDFVMVLAVAAEESGQSPDEMVADVMSDALARLHERGVLGDDAA